MSENTSSVDLTNMLGNLDLTTVQTEFPLINPGVYPVTVVEAKIESNKKNDGSNFNVKFATTEPAMGKVGANEVEVKAGYPFFYTISMVQTEKYDPRIKLAQFLEGVMGRRDIPFLPIEQFIGQDAVIKIKHEGTPDGPYGVQAKLDRIIKKG